MKKAGFYCYKCGDGISYPNKYTYEVLHRLGADFEYEKRFKWCVFDRFKSTTSTFGRYDFVIDGLRLIIEVDGGLGHGKTMHSKSKVSLEETKYRDEQKEILAKKNGYRLIRIDANYLSYKGRSEHMKNAILSSELSDFFDMSKIDWKEVDLNAQRSLVFQAVGLYENGLKVKEICKELGVSDHTIYLYLALGHRLGICSYLPQKKINIDSKEFSALYNLYKNNNLTINEWAHKLQISVPTLYKKIKLYEKNGCL